MKRDFLLSFIAIIVVAIFCSFNKTNDDVLRKEIYYNGEKIDNISVGSAFNVRIIKTSNSNNNRIEIRLKEEAYKYLKTTLHNGQLKVYLDYVPNKLLKILDYCYLDIYTTDFSSISGSGATDFKVEKGFEYSNLNLQLSGASDLEIDDNVNILESLYIQCSGKSDVDIIGNINTGRLLSLSLSGASDFTAKGTIDVLDRVKIACSGASKISFENLNVQGEFRASLSGASKLYIDLGKANADKNYINCSGSSHYNAPSFVLKNLNVKLSGASSAVINVLNSIDASVTTAASLRYKKNTNTQLCGVSKNTNNQHYGIIKNIRTF